MEVFPADIQWLVWRTFFTKFIVDEIIKTYTCTWKDPSDTLVKLCRDPGVIQQGHHELEDMIEDEDMWVWNSCIDDKCGNCALHGFPCGNLALYGFRNENIEMKWQPNFT